jgi:maltooligosyltrehalose trehalohydrolase
VWAPSAQRVSVVFDDRHEALLDAEPDGYFSGTIAASPGQRYQFQLDQQERPYPDPASRFQPDGPHASSEVIDRHTFTWTDNGWRGVGLKGQVVYEMHVGTFTPAGTWRDAERELPELASLGITVVELMPVGDFDGRFGWGYDGVNLWAPTRLYGRPDDLRHFVNRAHEVGVGVILDVVYNHFGPSGNYLHAFAPAYFTSHYGNEWGEAINFDGPNSGPVREFFRANAGYWIDEFHLDGLRLDATQQIFDRSTDHILKEIGAAVRAAAGGRATFVVAENERQDTRLVRTESEGGLALDGLWNDDFHHSASVALTGRAEAYYSDTRGDPQEFVSSAKYGYLFQGQHYHWQHQPRGTSSRGLHPWQFVNFLENHDQVANSANGRRMPAMTSPGKWRAMTTLLLLLPGTPMLFQGQEFAASAPFLYFADHEPHLAEAIRQGRAEFLEQFPSVASLLKSTPLDDPCDERTFTRCKLDFTERVTHAAAYRLHRDLLELRRDDPIFRRQVIGGIDGAVLSDRAFLLRFFAETALEDRLLIVNLGRDLHRTSIPEPLLAPPPGTDWTIRLSSEDPKYGGSGIAPTWLDEQWNIAGECAMVFAAGDRSGDRRPTPIKRRTA